MSYPILLISGDEVMILRLGVVVGIVSVVTSPTESPVVYLHDDETKNCSRPPAGKMA